MVQVEIIAIGNELLNGSVQDTNTHWLCWHITGLGGQIRRATLVGDDEAVIVDELRHALGRHVDLVFTTGGLGPTADDLTLRAVAAATGRDLALNAKALAQVKATYQRLAQEGSVETAELTPTRQKMAHLPAEAVPLANSVGAAPGVLLQVKRSAIISLPGVPAEFKAIFEDSLQPTLKEIFGVGTYLERLILVNCGDESVLAPILSYVSRRHPAVYIKSRAKSFGPELKFRVTLSASGTIESGVKQSLDAALSSLEQALNKAGISIEI